MRGAHVPRRLAHMGARIIPAYAGSTNWPNSRKLMGRDHPRVCGEHEVLYAARSSFRGSSPRMRGAHGHTRREIEDSRINPAYAGSTRGSPRRRPTGWDHPRVCGEHDSMIPTVLLAQGSSPRMRGAPLSTRVEALENRIIPAYAGSTRP